jgi:hypothetical protein
MTTKFEPNIDTCHEEIARLEKRLAAAGHPVTRTKKQAERLEDHIDVANEEIEKLEAALAALPKPAATAPKVSSPVAAPVVSAPKAPVTAELPKVAAPDLTGLARAIAGNSKSKPSAPAVKESNCMGLQRAINANILLKRQKSESNE